MDRVKKLIRAGARTQTAIREALGMTLTAFADKYGIPRSLAQQHITGRLRPSDATIAGLIAELGGTEAEWRELFWQAAKPAPVEAA